MQTLSRFALSFLTWSMGTLLIGSAAHAQAPTDYPNKPVSLVVGYPAGGSTDLVARTIGAELSKLLSQPVNIDNIGGEGGVLGAQKVADAKPDGYTLLLGASNEMSIAKLLNPNVRYDTQRDFLPIGLVATQPLVLVAGPHMKIKTVEEFVTEVKSKPGKYTYGSSGNGTALHLAGEMIKESSGAFMVHLPYRGVAPLTSDLLAGKVDFAVFVLSSALPHIRSGKFTPIGTTELRRAPSAPDIPALAETAALGKVNIGVWFALFAPANLPATVTARLREALGAATASPEVRKKLEEAGARPVSASSLPLDQVVQVYMKGESEKYSRVINFAKIRAGN